MAVLAQGLQSDKTLGPSYISTPQGEGWLCMIYFLMLVKAYVHTSTQTHTAPYDA